jgi:hypothetical protein
MQKSLLFFILPMLANAQVTITALEHVSVNVQPDVLRVNVSFEEQSKTPDMIKEHLNAIVAEIKRFDTKAEICRGGGYNLSPRYNYKDQKQEFIGYSGSLSVNCDFKTIEQYNTLTVAIDKVTAPNVRKNQGELTWNVSAIRQRETQDSLRAELLRKANTQATTFAKETAMMCEIASVNFGANAQIQPMMRGYMMAHSVETQSPIQGDTETSLEATVNYICSKHGE